MKIGILTFHRCINYGSFWQAFALADRIRQNGHEAVILDHYSKRVNRAEWKCALQPTLPTPVPAADIRFYKEKVRNFFVAFEKMPLSEPFPLEDSRQMEPCDLVIVGSDEVWNLSHPWYGYYPVFYGDGINASRKIAFGASFGNYDVSWRPDHEWVSKLFNFDAIAVRDKNSQTIITNILGFAPEMVPDPCLAFPPVAPEEKLPYPIPYAAVYGHNFSESFTAKAKMWAKRKKIKLISIGYRNSWADEQWLTAGPFEFAAFIAQAEVVVTNFFHGCVFSLINSKPFVCETTSYRNHKILDLMDKVGTHNRVISEETPVEEFNLLLNEAPGAVVEKKIAHWQSKAEKWLVKALAAQPIAKA